MSDASKYLQRMPPPDKHNLNHTGIKRSVMFYDENLKRWIYDDDPAAAANHRFRDHHIASKPQNNQECLICLQQPHPHAPSAACHPLQHHFIGPPKGRHTFPKVRVDVPKYPPQLVSYLSAPSGPQVTRHDRPNWEEITKPESSSGPHGGRGTRVKNAKAGPSTLPPILSPSQLPGTASPEHYDSGEESEGSVKGKERAREIIAVPSTAPQQALSRSVSQERLSQNLPNIPSSPPLSKIPQCRMPIHPNGMPCPLGEWHAPPGRPRPKSPPARRRAYVGRPSTASPNSSSRTPYTSLSNPSSPRSGSANGVSNNIQPISIPSVNGSEHRRTISANPIPPQGVTVPTPRYPKDSSSMMSALSFSASTPTSRPELPTQPAHRHVPSNSTPSIDVSLSPMTPNYHLEGSASPISPASSGPPGTPSPVTAAPPQHKTTPSLHIVIPGSQKPISKAPNRDSVYDTEADDAMIMEFERVTMTAPQVLLMPPTLQSGKRDLDRYAAAQLAPPSRPELTRYSLSDPGAAQTLVKVQPKNAKEGAASPLVKAKIFKMNPRS